MGDVVNAFSLLVLGIEEDVALSRVENWRLII